jgi:ribosomal protein S18 acetylase RimI-like enzyme
MSSSATVSAADHQALDNPIWSALTTRHQGLAEGSPLAWRYPPAIAPFAAAPDETPQALAALSGVIPPDGQLALFNLARVEPSPGIVVEQLGTIQQMIALAEPLGRAGPGAGAELVTLGTADVPAMLHLTDLAKPGPFGPRTHELGKYLGIRVGGQLAAMLGQRMQLNGYVEISAVCVHPEHRGKGYGEVLLTALIREIVAGGDVPILHVFTSNTVAIALYERLGFVWRQTFFVSRMGRAA